MIMNKLYKVMTSSDGYEWELEELNKLTLSHRTHAVFIEDFKDNLEDISLNCLKNLNICKVVASQNGYDWRICQFVSINEGKGFVAYYGNNLRILRNITRYKFIVPYKDFDFTVNDLSININKSIV